MKQNFGDHVSVATITEPEPAVAEEDEKPEETERKEFEFQSAAARYQGASGPVRHQAGGSEESPRDCGLPIITTTPITFGGSRKRIPNRAQEIEYIKQKVILVGPTGVGKTYLIKHIADLIKVPFVKADADEVQRDRLRRRRRGGSRARAGAQGRRRREPCAVRHHLH